MRAEYQRCAKDSAASTTASAGDHDRDLDDHAGRAAAGDLVDDPAGEHRRDHPDQRVADDQDQEDHELGAVRARRSAGPAATCRAATGGPSRCGRAGPSSASPGSGSSTSADLRLPNARGHVRVPAPRPHTGEWREEPAFSRRVRRASACGGTGRRARRPAARPANGCRPGAAAPWSRPRRCGRRPAAQRRSARPRRRAPRPATTRDTRPRRSASSAPTRRPVRQMSAAIE